ncbi:MAG: clostripain-related cysteine peptidase [Desulfomicrobium escambiense]|nr:clostripain-related cysteine peptidase [Desulfomicrobium escambiense]
MVYLAGDNNLTEDMVLALQDLQAAGAPEGDKIVAQFDPSGLGLFTQRYDFSTPKGAALDSYRDKTYAGIESNTGTAEALEDFVKWAHGKYGNLRRHLLILSGHGSGTTEDFLMSDETSRDSLTIPELKKALEATKAILGKKIDVLGMDACYMSMGEVAYEIRESADILIGAEGLEPEFGWPYGRILARARAFLGDATRNPTKRHLNPVELARAIVEEYITHYSDYDRSAGRSADLRRGGPRAARQAPH